MPLPLAGISFWAVVLQLTSALLLLPATLQVQLLPMALPVLLPRLVSVSPRSKQSLHCANALALPSAA